MFRILSCDPRYQVKPQAEVIIPHKGMTQLLPGDRVDVRVKSSLIVSPYKNYDEIKTFEIVAIDDGAYYLYVPHYYYLKDLMVADKHRCNRLGINLRFLNENIVYVQDNMICNVHSLMEGVKCNKCKEFYTYASANQPDDTFICYSCTFNPYR